MSENKYKKKLIEVAIPLEAINAASAREKSIRHGHPSTLHLWWARRPLAACRAVLFAQLVDDPSSDPKNFPTPEAQEAERKRLFDVIENLVKWENSTNEEVLERARAEIRKSCGGELPPVYDPFSGGGSIPLEAQRLGLPAYGSDLNPVAVMIGKAMIEIPPKFKDKEPIHPGAKDRHFYRNAEGLAEDVKYYGEWMREKAWERIGHLYPQVDLPKEYGGGKATVIAWIWARTVPSPDPAFSDVQVPIASSFLLSTKVGKEAWVEPIVDKQAKTISYRIRHGGTKAEIAAAKEGTKAGRGANFRCLMSDTAITPDYVKSNGRAGNMGQTLIAIVAEGNRSRAYVAPTEADERLALSAKPEWKPETSLPNDPRNFWTVDYGLTTFGDLFTDRQLVALNTFSDLVHEARERIETDALASDQPSDPTPLRDGGNGAKAYAEAVSVYLGMVVNKVADRHTSIATWDSSSTKLQLRNTFARQSIPMTWDFGEGNVFCSSSGAWEPSVNWVSMSVSVLPSLSTGSVVQENAQAQRIAEGKVISSDPPYYDNIGYADLSDFLFVWLRKALRDVYPDLFSLLATPKADELVATPYRHGGREAADSFFLKGMTVAIESMARQSSDVFPATIYYAFKQSEVAQEGISSTGWATFLQAVVEAGYAVVGTWPIRTEMANRMIASGTNALANSVVLVCRKKEATAESVTRAEFIRALKRELPPAISKLQAANIAPADMPQSAIGPGMGVFSRYKAVLESDDSPMSVKTALQLINRELDEYLGGIQGEFDADTRFAITWFEQNGAGKGDYLFRRMSPIEALFLIHSGVRVEGFHPASWRDFFSCELDLEDPENQDFLDLARQITAMDYSFDRGAPALIPENIRTVEEALLVGLVLAGQCRWPLVGPLTRLLPQYWSKARISVETASQLVRHIDLSPINLAFAGAHIFGITSRDIDRVFNIAGVHVAEARAALSLRQLFGSIARTDAAMSAADYYLPQMARILQLGDSSDTHRIRVFELLKSVQVELTAPRVHRLKGLSHPPEFGLPSTIQGMAPLRNADTPAEIAPRPIAAANPSPTSVLQSQREETRPGVRPIARKVPRNQGERP